MEIIFKSYHGIDIIEDTISSRDIKNSFDTIIKSMIDKINKNPSSKTYKPIAETTQIVSTVNNILDIYFDDAIDNKIEKYLLKSDEIADRLRIKEVIVQNKMSHLNGVQKGSLVQALIKDSEVEFRFFIAKIEHTNFVADADLILREGFNPDENKIWKTCIVKCTFDEEEHTWDIDEANIYMNHPAEYWPNEFLEMQELRTDEKNTREAWKGIEGCIKKALRKNAPSDYFVLRNAVINYFRCSQVIVYEDMIDSIFKDYLPIDVDSNEIHLIKEKLKTLPKINNFDSNFTSMPKQVKAKIKSVHKVNKSIDIIIRDGLDGDITEYKELIHTEVSRDGNRFVVIKVTEDETFNMLNLNKKDLEQN